MAKVKITQINSKNGATKRQIANLQSLGIHRLHQTVEVSWMESLQKFLKNHSALQKHWDAAGKYWERWLVRRMR